MKLQDYEKIIGIEKINEIKELAEKLKGKRIIMINSTKVGGGVAEILKSFVPLLNELGIETKWLVLKGDEKFFDTTKSFHNSLQGEENKDIKNKIKEYENFYKGRMEKLNSKIMEALNNLSSNDVVIIHDPQPLKLINYRKKDGSKWILRIHVDLSNPDKELWHYIENYAKKYDKIIVTKDEFVNGKKEKYKIIRPKIDVFSDKNKELGEDQISKLIKKNNIPLDKPMITQVSRLDKWKDPIGVISVYREVKKKIDCRLVLMFNSASDDPEGKVMYEKVMSVRKDDADILMVNGENPLLVNALQKRSDIILQKSIREGFALTVSEALWKETPVIATRVGGIPLQIDHGKNGYLVKNYKTQEDGIAVGEKEKEKHVKQTAAYIVELLDDKEKRRQMGLRGKQKVKSNFLITKHVKDYLKLIISITEKQIVAPLVVKTK